MKKKLAIKDHRLETRLFIKRIWALVAFVAVVVVCIIVRLFYLQILEHKFYSTLSDQNLLSIIPIGPKRGLIYDRNGVLLADNKASYTLELIPSKIDNLQHTITELGKIIYISPRDIDIFTKIAHQYHPFQPIPIKYKLSEQEVDQFLVNQYKFPGVKIEATLIRDYPLGATTSNVVGYVGRINASELQALNTNNYSASHYIGKVGIEKQYESTLHGEVGTSWVEIDASGHTVRHLIQHPARAGSTIYLTIDSKLQEVATAALAPEHGAVVAIEPNTGEILAMATNPNYDPNPFVMGLSADKYEALVKADGNPLFNRPIRGQFAAASTVKPFIALASLDEGIVNTQYTINDPGFFMLPNSHHKFHDWQPGHGRVDISKAIMESCDTYFYNLATKMGIERLDAALRRFGFGQATGVDMPEELPGLVPTPEWKQASRGQRWYTGDTVITGIGQGFLLSTPLQLAVSTATLAERGLHYQPHLVRKITDNDGVTTTTQPMMIEQVHISPYVWQTVINAMQKVVTDIHGTGEYFGRYADYSVAAKTGTAQVRGNDRNEEAVQTNIPKKFRNNHLFIAFAPVSHPKIAIAVVVEHSAKAAIVARKVMDYYLHKTVPRTLSAANRPTQLTGTGKTFEKSS
ncbi:MAG: penicillin-binding protein 2 [Gammaproteobacteria bacterium RIFCSPHIGHO2_12_FULL_41_15]|nr:MAG: penicillin-binding protein 2 [Gammaproteobacteria bacterium RIFCSPHIGHO2_12_FULL_41_15]